MKTHLVLFATADMSKAADLCIGSAFKHGVDVHWRYSPEIIRAWDQVIANPTLFASSSRAFGCWAWKPMILDRVMSELPDGEILIYSDSGVAFINNINYVIDRMDQDVWLYGNEWPHYMWCKRDIVEAIWPLQTAADKEQMDASLAEMSSASNIWTADFSNLSWARFGNQAQASVIFFRVNDKTRAFVKEWLDWCVKPITIRAAVNGKMEVVDQYYLIDDSPSRAPNHPDFRENRHDQAILTTLAYREGMKLHPWNVRYLTFEPARRAGYPEDAQLPILFLHHRLRDANWQEYETRTMR